MTALTNRIYHWLTDDHDDEFEVSDAHEWLRRHPGSTGRDGRQGPTRSWR